MQEFLNNISSELVTAIILAIAGWILNRKLKKYEEKRERERAAEIELADMKREKYEKEVFEHLKTIDTSVVELKSTVNSLSSGIKDLQIHDKEQDRIIRNIARTNRLNGQCTYELAQLVMVLSEGMRDQHLDGNITRAIDTYRKFESTTLKDALVNKDPTENDDRDLRI